MLKLMRTWPPASRPRNVHRWGPLVCQRIREIASSSTATALMMPGSSLPSFSQSGDGRLRGMDIISSRWRNPIGLAPSGARIARPGTYHGWVTGL